MPTAILGAGVSGRAAAQLLERFGNKAYRLFDQKQAGADRDLDAYLRDKRPRVLYSPGFAADHAWRQRAERYGLETQSELAFALKHWPGRLWAVTGTNGKSTLTAFLAQALRNQGVDAHPAGNIGEALSSLCARLPDSTDTLAVCEVSSFQAESLTYCQAEHIFWTNLAPDHLQRYGTLKTYAQAKAQLVKSAPQASLWAPASVYRIPGLSELPGKPTTSSWKAPCESLFAQAPYNELYTLAAAAWDTLGWSHETLAATARAFKPLPHRMQKVEKKGLVTYWNDSKATNTHAAQAAIDSLQGAPLFWIGGGAAKGESLEPFAQYLQKRIHKAYLIGETAHLLQSLLKPKAQRYLTLQEALHAAHTEAQALGAPCHVLLSPACASFDLFSDYAHRGNAFMESLRCLEPSYAP